MKSLVEADAQSEQSVSLTITFQKNFVILFQKPQKFPSSSLHRYPSAMEGAMALPY